MEETSRVDDYSFAVIGSNINQVLAAIKFVCANKFDRTIKRVGEPKFHANCESYTLKCWMKGGFYFIATLTETNKLISVSIQPPSKAVIVAMIFVFVPFLAICIGLCWMFADDQSGAVAISILLVIVGSIPMFSFSGKISDRRNLIRTKFIPEVMNELTGN